MMANPPISPLVTLTDGQNPTMVRIRTNGPGRSAVRVAHAPDECRNLEMFQYLNAAIKTATPPIAPVVTLSNGQNPDHGPNLLTGGLTIRMGGGIEGWLRP